MSFFPLLLAASTLSSASFGPLKLVDGGFELPSGATLHFEGQFASPIWQCQEINPKEQSCERWMLAIAPDAHLELYERGGLPEFDLVSVRHATPSVSISTSSVLSIDSSGALHGDGFRLHPPRASQFFESARELNASSQFMLNGPHRATLEIRDDGPLGYSSRIDPLVDIVSRPTNDAGGPKTDFILRAPDGNVLLVGNGGAFYPITPGALNNGLSHTLIATKMSADGASIIWSADLPYVIDMAPVVVDAALATDGTLYVAGITAAGNDPTDCVVTALSADGSQSNGVFQFGGSGHEAPTGIAVAPDGSVIVTGYTQSTTLLNGVTGFDTTHNGGEDIFVVRLNSSLTQILNGTYLGGSGDERATQVHVSSTGVVTVFGNTKSSNYPTQTPYQAALRGSTDGVITRFPSTALNTLQRSTYFGDSGDYEIRFGTVDNGGRAAFASRVGAGDYPLVGPNFNPPGGESYTVVVTNSDLSALELSALTPQIEALDFLPNGGLVFLTGSGSQGWAGPPSCGSRFAPPSIQEMSTIVFISPAWAVTSSGYLNGQFTGSLRLAVNLNSAQIYARLLRAVSNTQAWAAIASRHLATPNTPGSVSFPLTATLGASAGFQRVRTDLNQNSSDTCVRCDAGFGDAGGAACSATSPSCGVSGVCSPCNGNAGSGSSQACSSSVPVCSGGSCQGCTSSSQCTGSLAICNTTTSRCQSTCTGDHLSGSAASCPSPSQPICSSGACVQCTLNSHCAQFQYCSTGPGTCAAVPNATLVAPNDGAASNSPPTLQASHAGDSIQFYLDGALLPSCTTANGSGQQVTVNCSLPPSITDGAHTFSAESVKSGAVGQRTANRTFTIDRAAPSVTGTNFPAGQINQTSYALSWTASDNRAGVTSQCRIGTGAFSPCTSPLALTSLSQGNNAVTIRAVDAVGNTSADVTGTINVDSIAPNKPTITAPANGAIVGTSIQVTISAETGSGVALFVDGSSTPAASIASCSGGSCSAVLSGLSSGARSIRARATDAASNQSVLSDPLSVTVDLSTPTLTISGCPAASTNASQATLQFTSSAPGATYRCALDGAAASPCTTGYVLNLSTLTEAAHSVSIIAQSQSGIDSAPAQCAFSIDRTAPPTPLITAPVANALLRTDSVLTTGTATDAVLVRLVVDQGAPTQTAVTSNAFSQLITALGEGAHTLQAIAVDAAGNLSSASQVSFSVDRTAPVITFVAVPTPLSNIKSPALEVSANEPGVTFAYAIDAPNGPPSTSTTAQFSVGPLVDGSHTVRVVGTDLAGNSSNELSVSFVVDTVPPSAPQIQSPLDGATLEGDELQVSGRSEPNAVISIAIGGAAPLTTTANAAGDWSMTLDVTSVIGTQPLSATAIDAAGNRSAAAGRTVVRPPLDVLLDTPRSNESIGAALVRFSGSSVPDAVVEIEQGAQLICTAVAAPTGQFSCEAPLPEGTYTVVARASKGAAKGITATRSFTVDRRGPALSWVREPASNVGSEALFDFAAPGAAAVYYQLDGGELTPTTSPLYLDNLAFGQHTVVLVARDASGNESRLTHMFVARGSSADLGCGCQSTDPSYWLWLIGAALHFGRRRHLASRR